MIGSALLAGITGFLLGVSSGRIRGVDDAATPFGMLWVASIAVAVGVFATGGMVTSRAAAQLTTGPAADPDGAPGRDGDARSAGSGSGSAWSWPELSRSWRSMVALGRA